LAYLKKWDYMLASSLRRPDPGLIALRNGLGAVPGVRLAGVHAGIKPRKRDLAIVAFDHPRVAASVITTNEIKAAPLLVSERHLKAGIGVNAIVCNSGCANACTGERGERDALEMARQASALLDVPLESVLVASTGVIGVPLAMDCVKRGVERAISHLEEGSKAAFDAAEAIMTTDRVPKLAAYAFYHDDCKYVVGGIAKGSGMIAPNMATMLAFVATDFAVSQHLLQASLTLVADGTFNMISVDGDMSTNDAVYAFAPLTAEASSETVPESFQRALQQVCLDLALAMVADGEGATKRLELTVSEARDVTQARKIARAIVDSNLVKTALFGEDPNWGRIVAAAGSARIGMHPDKWSLLVNGKPWVDRGGDERLSDAEAHRELEASDIAIELCLGIGEARAVAWGCDLSRDYVRINASYRT
jgi:glutamate N-acetyltransferase/amino-acid N-acetyltransferase